MGNEFNDAWNEVEELQAEVKRLTEQLTNYSRLEKLVQGFIDEDGSVNKSHLWYWLKHRR